MKTKMIVAALVLAAPLAATADVSYKYAEIDYVNANLDVAGSPDGTGFGLKTMFELSDRWHGLFEYTDATIEFPAPFGDLDFTAYRLGAGYHTELASGVDGIAEITYDSIDGGTSETGFGLKFGLRGMASDDLELNGHVRYTSVDTINTSDTLIGVGAAYSFNDQFAVTFGYESGDVGNWAVGLRVNF